MTGAEIIKYLQIILCIQYLWMNLTVFKAVRGDIMKKGKSKCDVNKRVKCNIVKDCHDFSDEKDCKDSIFNCDMENFKSCGIENIDDDVTRFEILTANEARRKANGGPTFDHTLKTSQGHIAYSQHFFNITKRTTMKLPIFLAGSSGVKGCFGFYLSMKSTSYLKVFKRFRNANLPVIIYRSIDQSQWVKIEFPITHETTMVTIETGNGGDDDDDRGYGYVAIDDLFIKRGECKLKAIPALRCHSDGKAASKLYKCKDGSGCIDNTFVCDMQKNCRDGSDEEDCQSYYCPGTAQMVLKNLICNGYPDCLLGEDETSCTCGDDEYECKSGGCVKKKLLCDGYPDCLDGSDESSNCPCGGFFCNFTNKCMLLKCHCVDPKVLAGCACEGFRCTNRQCISQHKVCDEYEDCYDGSDEHKCKTCKEGQVMCPRGIKKCIQREWMCDGSADCPGAWDEKDCQCEMANQFKCNYKHQCIAGVKRCDGVMDCLDGSDEFRCVYINSEKIVEGYKSKRYYQFCSHLWSKSWFEKVCSISGEGPPFGNITVSTVPPNTSLLVAIKKGEFTLKNFVISSACPTKFVIHLSCRPKNCGQQGPPIFSPYIIGGDVSLPGQWPYVVSIFRYSSYLCTGTIIHPEWVLTAAHCFTFMTTSLQPRETYFMPWIFKVRAGTNLMMGSGGSIQEVRVKEVHKNHFFDDSLIYPDIALVKLSKPLIFNDFVKPACLPEIDLKSMQCFVLGWGITNIDDFDEGTLYLRHAKMHLDLNTRCILHRNQKNLLAGQMCLGYYTETVKPCHGDSGGPLLCKSLAGFWSVVGLVSTGPDSFGTCASKSSMGSIFTDVEFFRDWITHTMST